MLECLLPIGIESKQNPQKMWDASIVLLERILKRMWEASIVFLERILKRMWGAPIVFLERILLYF